MRVLAAAAYCMRHPRALVLPMLHEAAAGPLSLVLVWSAENADVRPACLRGEVLGRAYNVPKVPPVYRRIHSCGQGPMVNSPVSPFEGYLASAWDMSPRSMLYQYIGWRRHNNCGTSKGSVFGRRVDP